MKRPSLDVFTAESMLPPKPSTESVTEVVPQRSGKTETRAKRSSMTYSGAGFSLAPGSAGGGVPVSFTPFATIPGNRHAQVSFSICILSGEDALKFEVSDAFKRSQGAET